MKKQRFGVAWKTVLGICFIFPVIIAFLFSFLPNDKLLGLPTLQTFFEHFTFENYKWVFANIPIFKYVTNSLQMCLIVIVAQSITACLAAYAFAFFKFKGKDTLFQIILIAMMVPGEVCTICNFLTVRDMGLVNTMMGLTIVSLVSCNSIFMMRQSYLSLPGEMREATMMDGCGEIRYMLQFAVPLSIPTIASLAITTFISVFNAYLWPLLVSRSPEHYTVQIGMALLVDHEVPTYGRQLAGAVLCMIIPIIFFVIFQSYMVKGLTKGAVKG
ncbi:MAG: carbohydrate ABC transporter permease [Ruminococcaceae bacterium]|nr:carbohydrate ABC transporter permease [Oscillospiraceae bacterium]